ncbi:hypothetical protein G6F50_015821 [Rhizopus delemar]|uniref:Uncharacterized protein n=1 Tax=Rhizopus delemar TaxID=936053 RepID=A0A9P7C315_9FUNG|nr:hypothetical protein G6F50_015821 [Rhizopus delemar]
MRPSGRRASPRNRQQLAAVTALGLETVVDDVGTDLDQLPQHRLVTHDLGVGHDVGRRRRSAGQLDQVGAVADQLQLALRFEPLAQGDRVERPNRLRSAGR